MISNIKDFQKEQQLHKNRITIALVFALLAFVSLLIHLFKLQIIEYQRYNTYSQNNRINILPIPPNRGLIYDRNGILLAENRPINELEINLKQIKNLKETLDELSKIIPITETDRQRFTELLRKGYKRTGVPIKTNISHEDLAKFAVNRHKFPGIEMTAKSIRYYPYKEELSHVLGYISRINEQELEFIDQENYAGTDYIGKLGIEKYYEEALHGQVGKQEVEINARGRINKIINQHLPVPGNDLYLTLDINLQKVAIEMLKDKRGAVVAIDPNNGDVLAMVSNPGFDNNLFVSGISQAAYAELQKNIDKPLYNRAIRGLYSPGSTVKPIIAMMGLITNTVNPHNEIYDPGYYTLPGETHQYKDMSAHGYVDLRKSIVVSCNVYYYTLARALGIEKLEYIFKQFGYGNKTNIDITDELPGVVPSKEWKKKTLGGAWYPGETILTGIGQGYLLITPIQLAQAASIIANRGKLTIPHLLLQQKLPNGEFIRYFKESADTPLTPYQTAFDYVIDGMEGVIKEGTARSILNPQTYPIAGKTGTAQVTKDSKTRSARERNHKLFMSFAPANNPKIAIGIIIENGDGLYPTGVQITRKMMDTYLSNSDTTNNEHITIEDTIEAPISENTAPHENTENIYNHDHPSEDED
jgi:penicillin-binding protein 2